MKTLLTLKHWQAFILLFVLPFVFQVIGMLAIALNQDAGAIVVALPLFIVMVMVLYFGWFYTLGTHLHKKLPDTIPMNLKKFKWFLFFPILYILLICIVVLSLVNSTLNEGPPNPALFLVIIPLHLFSIFCIFYCMYFIAKALKSLELQRTKSFSDFALEFVLIWMFPIGIWIIQPRLNKIFDPASSDDSQQALDSPME